MLKIINLDIMIFNHIFDIFNGGEGLHADFKAKEDEKLLSAVEKDEKLKNDFKKRPGQVKTEEEDTFDDEKVTD
jgi:hypothetical protein